MESPGHALGHGDGSPWVCSKGGASGKCRKDNTPSEIANTTAAIHRHYRILTVREWVRSHRFARAVIRCILRVNEKWYSEGAKRLAVAFAPV